MKKYFIILTAIIIIILGYIVYKTYLLMNYKVNVNAKIIEMLNEPIDTIKITTNDNINDLLKFNDIMYKKPDHFEFDEEQTNNGTTYLTYYLNEEDLSNYIAVFKVGKTYSIYDVLTVSKGSPFDVDFKKVDGRYLLEEYNLDNDYDIFKYILKHNDDKVNIFSSIDEIKMNYLIKTFINTVIPISKISLIVGDLQGYMYTLNDDSIYQVHLINNDDNYWFNFTNNQNNKYFTLGDIKKFISNVLFTN